MWSQPQNTYLPCESLRGDLISSHIHGLSLQEMHGL